MGASRTTERLDSPFARAPTAVEAPAAVAAPRTERPAPPRTERAPLTGLRPLTGYEEELLERRRDEPNTAALCNEVLARCLVPPGEDPGARRDEVGRLLVAERDRALVALRRMSFGDEVKTALRCPHCGKASDISFRLSDLPLGAEGPPPPAELDVTLEDGREVRLRLPTAADQAALLDEAPETVAERRTWLLARLVTRLGEQPGPVGLHEVRALRSADRHRLEAELERVVPQVDLSMDVTCSACSAAFTAPFDIASFFLLS
ncbi:hypothetical protein HPC49_34495 [Pyxidicoccus fallax]|uniref:T4 bacteriophage base plate protein n=1 Tax=Pyxidicoccus fallax TaxID=394095 RepID=A0A848LW21_9BACT|nr:hypothetical protein [Pyxidicoccus fallax]NMO21849.1 hypothetical protein [Pyxidicoccus fallax]NPC83319.1 hypothetical protein [Pyxidicoccus fallax]